MTIYLLEVSCRDRDGKQSSFFPERDTSDLTRAETVKDIRTGQYEDVSRVIAVDLADGRAWDATRDIARDILNELDEPPLPFLQDFLECALGVGVVASVLREMEAA